MTTQDFEYWQYLTVSQTKYILIRLFILLFLALFYSLGLVQITPTDNRLRA